MTTNYQPIPKTYTKYGDHFKLRERHDDFVIYERRIGGPKGEIPNYEHSCSIGGDSRCYWTYGWDCASGVCWRPADCVTVVSVNLRGDTECPAHDALPEEPKTEPSFSS